MRYLFVLFFFVSFVGTAQFGNDRLWSVSASAGVQIPFAPDNFVSTGDYISFSQFQLSLRYMFNEKYGLQGHYGRNHFEADNSGMVYNRFMLEGVVNIGEALYFQNRRRSRWDFLGHLGGGLTFTSVIRDGETQDNPDRIGTLMVGLTSLMDLGPQWDLLGDVSLITNYSVQNAYNGQRIEPNTEEGFFGAFVNVSLGVVFYFGR